MSSPTVTIPCDILETLIEAAKLEMEAMNLYDEDKADAAILDLAIDAANELFANALKQEVLDA